LFPLFGSGVVDTRCKFAAGIVDIDGKFATSFRLHQRYRWQNLPPVLLILLANFATGVVETGGKFAGVVDSGGTL
jgi:hypothetical protein